MIALAWEGIEKLSKVDELYIRPMMPFDRVYHPGRGQTQFILTVFSRDAPGRRKPDLVLPPSNAGSSTHERGRLPVSQCRACTRRTRRVTARRGAGRHWECGRFATNNLFIVRNWLQTPAPNGSFLSGLTRRRIMDFLAEDGHEIQETTLTLDDVYNAHEVFRPAILKDPAGD